MPRDDDDLARRTTEAVTLIGRRANRDRAGSAALGIALPRPTSVWLRCRAGAAATVEDQVRTLLLPEHPQLGVTRRGRAAVEITWGGTLAQLYRVRSFVDVALSFPLPDGATVVDRVLAGLDHPELVAALQAWTAGPIRFRLAFAQGRRRAAVWTVAKTLAERGSALVNDSRAVAWTIEVDEQHGRLWCVPKGADPRFRYRLADVPAATHPTLAALMAWVGRPQPGEVVWDPFCGTGTELIECATVSTGLHLWGTEVEAEALAGARRNVAAAGIESASLQLVHGSALDTRPRHEGRGVSLILSNPPMGRRVMVEGRGMRRLLDDFVAHAARLLHPGGRVVWLSPAPRATAASARHLGLHVEDLDVIDMGGFFTTPQVLRRDG
ncbi:MAG: methyltransferase [Deltaproteobacteria bacterium]|nr:methyltransferase [Deltaproteobacteria bacterium]